MICYCKLTNLLYYENQFGGGDVKLSDLKIGMHLYCFVRFINTSLPVEVVDMPEGLTSINRMSPTDKIIIKTLDGKHTITLTQSMRNGRGQLICRCLDSKGEWKWAFVSLSDKPICTTVIEFK